MIDMSDISANLAQMPAKIENATVAYAQTVAADLQRQAQQNRPWTDRTGQARQRLRGWESKKGTAILVNLAHGVDYGEKLEYGHERRYAIVEPTLRANERNVINGWIRELRQL